MSDSEIDVRVRVLQEGVQGGLKSVENAVSSATKNIENSFVGANGALGSLKSSLAGFAEVAAAAFALEKIKDFIEETAHLGVQLERLSQKTGISAEELGGLKAAADETGTPIESLAKGLQLLAKTMQATAEGAKGPASAAFKELGISVVDASGRMRPMEDVMFDVSNKFASMEDGATKTALAMRIFGRGGAEMIPFLNQGGDAIREMKGEAEALGAVMNQAGVDSAVEYHHAMTKVGLVGQAVSITIGQTLIPVITELANAFVDSAKQGGLFYDVMDGIKKLLQALVITFEVLKLGIIATMTFVVDSLNSVARATSNLGLALHAAATGDFSRAWAIIRNTGERASADYEAMMAKIRKDGDDTMKTLFGVFGLGLPETKTPKSAGPMSFGGGKTKDTRHAELADEMEGFRLEEEAAQGNAEKIVLIRQRELAATRALFAENSKEVLRARLELQKAEDAHRKQATKTADDMIQMQRDHALAGLAIEREQINGERALGSISATEELARVKALMEREFVIRRDAAMAERDLLDKNTEAYRQADAKVQAIIDAHAVAVVQNANQTTLAIKQQWETVFSAINNAIQSSINGVIQGTQTAMGALRGILGAILQEFIAMGVKSFTAHRATELAKTGVTAQGAAARVAIETWAAVKSVAITAASILKSIAMHAVHAIAAAWAAISAIPFVGPFLAPAVALGTGALVLALGSRIASAAGGYDIPSGINPVTQLHANEMVLPAPLADVIRGMAGSGGQGGSGGDTHHYTIHALDAKSFESFLHKNGDTVGRVIKKQVREGKLG